MGPSLMDLWNSDLQVLTVRTFHFQAFIDSMREYAVIADMTLGDGRTGHFTHGNSIARSD